MNNLAEKIISFYAGLDFTDPLPDGISIMNPFRENNEIFNTVKSFYRKFYNDNNIRRIILGINPGRFGAGTTGIPFTDTVRMEEKCGLTVKSIKTHELSSVFMYDMIDSCGGTESFYHDYYISAVCPLGLSRKNRNGRDLNYNYYDSKTLSEIMMDFIIKSLKIQLEFGISREVCYCLGSGKNYRFLDDLNKKFGFFENIVPLEHPRFIMQYRLKKKQYYIEKYVCLLGKHR